jgi:ABC-type polar amino acid transport system ATPase subunit
MLSAKNVSNEYSGRSVLDSVNIVVEPGTITSLIGPSGAGKTTLLRVLSGSDAAGTGKVILEGRDYLRPSPTVVVVFQQLFLWPHLTLRQNISLSGRSTFAEVDDLIKVFSMEEFADRYPNQASLGERQRAALARAIALKPKYLLLDEVTSALDIEQTEKVANYLLKLKDEDMGILVVTHLVQFARRISDYVLFMDKGEIVERGGKELITSPQKQRTKDFLKYF